jgi:hypothetical protein
LCGGATWHLPAVFVLAHGPPSHSGLVLWLCNIVTRHMLPCDQVGQVRHGPARGKGSYLYKLCALVVMTSHCVVCLLAVAWQWQWPVLIEEMLSGSLE